MTTQNFLAGDIGGTKVHLAVIEKSIAGVKVTREARYVSAHYASFTDILADYVRSLDCSIDSTGLGIAGPVTNRACQATNLPWHVDAASIEDAMPLGPVALLNDFQTAALGVLHLDPQDWHELNPGQPEAGAPIAVLGAGTGLGEAFLFHNGERYQVIATEGGHKDFAPRNEDEMALLRFMLKRHQRVSYERLVSGAGIVAIYEHLTELSGSPIHPMVEAAMVKGDPAAVIAQLGAENADPLSARAMQMFAGIYGAEAGNMVLQVLARGGVYVAGGIAPKNLELMTCGIFQSAYKHKGRFSDLVASIPVRLVTNPYLALIGAASAAEELLQTRGRSETLPSSLC